MTNFNLSAKISVLQHVYGLQKPVQQIKNALKSATNIDVKLNNVTGRVLSGFKSDLKDKINKINPTIYVKLDIKNSEYSQLNKKIKTRLNTINAYVYCGLKVNTSTVNSLKKQLATELKGVSAQIDIKLNRNAASTIQGTSKSVLALSNGMNTLSNSTLSANSALTVFLSLAKQVSATTASIGRTSIKVGQQGPNIGTGRQSSSRGYDNINPPIHSSQLQASTKSLFLLNQEMIEFGKLSGVLFKRFAGFSLASTAILGLKSSFSDAISESIDFQDQMVKIAQTTGMALDSLSGLSREVGNVSVQYGISSKELIIVSKTLAQAGFSIQQTQQLMKTIGKASLSPSFNDINTLTQTSIAAMRQFGLQAHELESALDIINQISADYAVEAEDLGVAIRKAGGSFIVAAGDSKTGTEALREFLSVFASVRDTTQESAETISNGLKTIFARIQRPETIEQFNAIGIELSKLGKNGTQEFIGMYNALEKLNDALFGTKPITGLQAQAIFELVGGARELEKSIPLLKEFQKAQRIKKDTENITKPIDLNAEQAAQSLSRQFEITRQNFLRFVRDLGETETIKALVKDFLNLANSVIAVAEAFKPLLPILTLVSGFKISQAVSSYAYGFSKGLGVRGASPSLGISRKPSFSTGGYVDAKVMPGEMIYGPNQVKQIGVGKLRQWNQTGQRTTNQNGMVVPGYGNTDSVPMKLAVGSFVVKKRSVQKGYSNGGYVDFDINEPKNKEKILKLYIRQMLDPNYMQYNPSTKAFDLKNQNPEIARQYIKDMFPVGALRRTTAYSAYTDAINRGYSQQDAYAEAKTAGSSARPGFFGRIGLALGMEHKYTTRRRNRNAEVLTNSQGSPIKMPSGEYGGTTRSRRLRRGGLALMSPESMSKVSKIAGAGALASGYLQGEEPSGASSATIGALGGVAIGAEIGGPVGAVAGAVIGGAAGYVGGSRQQAIYRNQKEFDIAQKEANLALSKFAENINKFDANNIKKLNESIAELGSSARKLITSAQGEADAKEQGWGYTLGLSGQSLQAWNAISKASLTDKFLAGGPEGLATNGQGVLIPLQMIVSKLSGKSQQDALANITSIMQKDQEAKGATLASIYREAGEARLEAVFQAKQRQGKDFNPKDFEDTFRLLGAGDKTIRERLGKGEKYFDEQNNITSLGKAAGIAGRQIFAEREKDRQKIKDTISQLNAFDFALDFAAERLSLFATTVYDASQEMSTGEFALNNQLDFLLGGRGRTDFNLVNPFDNPSVNPSRTQSAIESLRNQIGSRSPEASLLIDKLNTGLVSTLAQPKLAKTLESILGNIKTNSQLDQADFSALRDVMSQQASALGLDPKVVKGPIEELVQALKQQATVGQGNDGAINTTDIQQKMQQILDSWGKSLKDGAKLYEALLEPTKRYLGQMDKLTDATIAYRERVLEATILRTEREFDVKKMRGENISAASIINAEDAIVQGLAGSLDPEKIAQSITDKQSRITELRSQLRNDLPGSPKFAKTSEEIQSLEISLNDAQKALSILATSTKGLTAIQDDLAKVDQRRQAQRSFSDRLTGASMFGGDAFGLNESVKGAFAILSGQRTTAQRFQGGKGLLGEIGGLLPEDKRANLEKFIFERQADILKKQGIPPKLAEQLALAATKRGESPEEQKLITAFEKLSEIQAKAIEVSSGLPTSLDNLKISIDSLKSELETKAIAIIDQAAQQANVEAKAAGGFIGGSYKGRDTELMKLMPGEFVVRRNVAQKYGQQLMALNSGVGPDVAFADGGKVTARNVINKLLYDAKRIQATEMINALPFIGDNRRAVIGSDGLVSNTLGLSLANKGKAKYDPLLDAYFYTDSDTKTTRKNTFNHRLANRRRGRYGYGGFDPTKRFRMRGFADGGSVDSVLAAVTPGEFVVRKEVAQKHENFLHSLNKSGNIPKFANGGVVGKSSNGNIASNSSSDMGRLADAISKFDVSKLANELSRLADKIDKLSGLKITMEVAPIKMIHSGQIEVFADKLDAKFAELEEKIKMTINRHINPITGETNETYG